MMDIEKFNFIKEKYGHCFMNIGKYINRLNRDNFCFKFIVNVLALSLWDNSHFHYFHSLF